MQSFILTAESFPSTTLAPTTHIVSFVKQRRVKQRHDEFLDFNFENSKNKTMLPLNLLAGRLMVEQIDTNLNNYIENSTSNETASENNFTKSTKITDDAPNQMQNTLENSKENENENEIQHESSMRLNASDPLWNRVKQSIPVLESVKNLLSTVRDGSFNHNSSSVSHHMSHSKHHHQLVSPNGNSNQTSEHHDSAAIETEEEREMVNESTGFQFLELLGRIAGMIWGFFTNIQKFFAASSGNASAASSSLSSGSK